MNFWEDFSFFTNNTIRLSGFYTEIDYSFPIYRARKKDFNNLTDKKELTYLQKENCTKIGRANVPYHPVFYGSFEAACAVKELKLFNDEDVILTQWQWRESSNLRVKLFAKNEHNDCLKRFNIKTIENYINAIEIFKGSIEKNNMLNEMISNSSHLSNLFLIEDDYFASAIVGFEELYRSRLSSLENIDAIVYPSIVCENQINIAVHPEIVDEFLELKKIWLLNSSNPNDQNLIWSHIN